MSRLGKYGEDFSRQEPKLFGSGGVSNSDRSYWTEQDKLESIMKTIPVSLVVAGLLLPAIGLAGPENPSPPKGEGKLKIHGEGWKLADTDHDGFISLDEFQAMPRLMNLPEDKRQNIFKRLDKDGDGKLSRDELGRFGKPPEGQDRPMKRLWELDVDRSGGVSLEELKAGDLFKKLPADKQEKLFRRLDSNGDGVISPEDKPEPFKRFDGKGPGPEGGGPPRDEPGRINKALDTNGDGALSFDEFRTGPAVRNLSEDQQEDRFELLDRNHDQKISADDFSPPASPAVADPK